MSRIARVKITMFPKRLTGYMKSFEAEHGRRVDMRTCSLLEKANVTTAAFPKFHGPNQNIIVYVDPGMTHIDEAGNPPRLMDGNEYPVAREVALCDAYLKGYRDPTVTGFPAMDKDLMAVIGNDAADMVTRDAMTGIEEAGTFVSRLIELNILARHGFDEGIRNNRLLIEENLGPIILNPYSDSYVLRYFERLLVDPDKYPGLARIAMFHKILRLAGIVLLLPLEEREKLLKEVGFFWGDQVKRLLEWINLAKVNISELLSPEYLFVFTPQNQWVLFEKVISYLKGDESIMKFPLLPDVETTPETQAEAASVLFERSEYYAAYHIWNSVVGKDVSTERKMVAKALVRSVADENSLSDLDEVVEVVTDHFIENELLREAITFEEDMDGMDVKAG